MLHRKLNFNLKAKILITSTIIIIPIIIFIAFISFRLLTSSFLESSASSLISKSRSGSLYIESLLSSNKKLSPSKFLYEYAPYISDNLSDRFNVRVQIYDTAEKKIYDSSPNSLSLFNRDIKEAIDGNKSYIIKNIDGTPYILLSTPIFSNNKVIGAFRFVYNDSAILTKIHTASLRILLLSIFALVLGIILFYSFATKITEPIIKLTNFCKTISKGDYSKEVAISSGDELELLGSTFNEMSKNIEASISKLENSQKEQKAFFDNISHEFKTPLTSIIGFSEIIPEIDDREKLEECAYYISKEGKRLLSLVEEILAIAKIEKSNFQIDKKFYNLHDILSECLFLLKPDLDKYHIIIENTCITYFVYCDHDKTKQVFLNVLSNAIKYSGCEIITVSSRMLSDKFQVFISDDGIGFDTSNPQSKTSTGFGLKICSSIMESQNGYFSVESTLDSGTTCTFSFFKQSREKGESI